eukprot:TRINITY_DN35850_c0_g1_i10.p1 TRINITY_DN35850_c0_g1~~TRINITY_DN35850_c0_g1_i10.p1  ORF type:complete len:160 (-),score=25.80 TRINITY_DN35850_c0_g1_i10:117-596(-)
MEAVLELLHLLTTPGNPVVFRFKVDTILGFTGWNTSTSSPTFMGSNLLWQIRLSKEDWKISINCCNLSDWKEAKVCAEVDVQVYKPSEWGKHTLTTVAMLEFTSTCSSVGLKSVMDKASLQENGFVSKLSKLHLEVRIRVVKMEGISDYSGITEEKLAP